MPGRTWKGAAPEALVTLREILIRRGGVEDKELRSPHEMWRVRIEGVVFTAYRSGTVYCTGGRLPELPFLYRTISEVLRIE